MNYKTFYLLFLVFLLPTVASAQYTPIVGIPGVDPNADFGAYINALYALSISIAALLAVIKIIIAGVKWMLTDVVTSKEEAKKDIWGATLGLLVVISAVLVLRVINPQLVETSVFIDPAEDIGAGAPFVFDAKANCQGTWVDTTASADADGGYCVPAANEGVNLGVEKEVSCGQPQLDPVTNLPTNYDCSQEIAECEANFMKASPKMTADGQTILKYAIICSP